MQVLPCSCCFRRNPLLSPPSTAGAQLCPPTPLPSSPLPSSLSRGASSSSGKQPPLERAEAAATCEGCASADFSDDPPSAALRFHPVSSGEASSFMCFASCVGALPSARCPSAARLCGVVWHALTLLVVRTPPHPVQVPPRGEHAVCFKAELRSNHHQLCASAVRRLRSCAATRRTAPPVWYEEVKQLPHELGIPLA